MTVCLCGLYVLFSPHETDNGVVSGVSERCPHMNTPNPARLRSRNRDAKVPRDAWASTIAGSMQIYTYMCISETYLCMRVYVYLLLLFTAFCFSFVLFPLLFFQISPCPSLHNDSKELRQARQALARSEAPNAKCVECSVCRCTNHECTWTIANRLPFY